MANRTQNSIEKQCKTRVSGVDDECKHSFESTSSRNNLSIIIATNISFVRPCYVPIDSKWSFGPTFAVQK